MAGNFDFIGGQSPVRDGRHTCYRGQGSFVSDSIAQRESTGLLLSCDFLYLKDVDVTLAADG